MNFKQLATSIASFAPTLATMLGGPLAGVAVSALASALGLKQGASGEDVTQAIQAGTVTPDQLVAIRTADLKHAEILGQQSIDLAKLNADHEEAFAKTEADDRANARGREIAVKDNTPRILAYGVLFATVILEGYLVIRGIPKLDAQMAIIVGRVLGTFDTATALILGYYFGSSSGSASKTDTINKIAAATAK